MIECMHDSTCMYSWVTSSLQTDASAPLVITTASKHILQLIAHNTIGHQQKPALQGQWRALRRLPCSLSPQIQPQARNPPPGLPPPASA
mmetsp:Transcript_27335/g.73928  ORF Transcript_27335/g.73928 Transcript_27335/m.73928 type:complete len:89 (-) Transcript_27335:1912-2178(-)